jgi:hypothetical protein
VAVGGGSRSMTVFSQPSRWVLFCIQNGVQDTVDM